VFHSCWSRSVYAAHTAVAGFPIYMLVCSSLRLQWSRVMKAYAVLLELMLLALSHLINNY